MNYKEEQILKLIVDGYNITTLSYLSKTSYSHTFKIIKSFKNKKYLTINKVGRDSIINLTEKGRTLRKELFKMEKLE